MWLFLSCYRFWETICHPAESHQTDHQRPRRHRPVRPLTLTWVLLAICKHPWCSLIACLWSVQVSVWYGKDGHVLCVGAAVSWHPGECSDPRVLQLELRNHPENEPKYNSWFTIRLNTDSEASGDDITQQCVSCLQVRETQALILAPTRELAGQIQKVVPLTPRQPSSSVSRRSLAGFWLDLSLLCAGAARSRRLYECPVSRLHRGNQRRRGHQEAGLWSACGGGDAWTGVWWDHTQVQNLMQGSDQNMLLQPQFSLPTCGWTLTRNIIMCLSWSVDSSIKGDDFPPVWW